MRKKKPFLALLIHLFTPSLDPVRAVMPNLDGILHNPRLPRRMLAAIAGTIISLLLVALGAAGNEVRNARNGREAKIEQLIERDHPALENRVLVLELDQAALKGTQQRMEGKLDAANAQLSGLTIAITKLQATLNQIAPERGNR